MPRLSTTSDNRLHFGSLLDWARVFPVVILALVVFELAYITAVLPARYWIDTLFDDSYYYLGVARNLSLGRGSMFAPPLSTNGYQPLWLVLMTAVSILVHADRHLLALATHIVSAAFIALFVVISGLQERRLWLAAVIALAYPWVFLVGMETVLLPPLILLYLRTDGWTRGLLAGLIVLSRLDALSFVVACEAVTSAQTKGVRLEVIASVAMVALVYASVNTLLFDVPVPVSGLAKSVGNRFGENWPVGLAFLFSNLPALVAAMLIAMWRENGRSTPNSVGLVSSLLSTVCTAFYYGLFSGWSLWGWYGWPAAMLCYFGFTEVGNVGARSRRIVIAVLLAANAAIGMSVLPILILRPIVSALFPNPKIASWGEANAILAQQLPNFAKPGSTFAMGDRAGSFGYLLPDGYGFVQTEGLVADLPYLQALRTGRGEQFLSNIPVDYFVADREGYWVEGDTAAVPEPIQGLSAHSGVMLFCFPRSASIDLGAVRPEQKVFRFADRVACPAWANKLLALRQRRYGDVQRQSVAHVSASFL